MLRAIMLLAAGLGAAGGADPGTAEGIGIDKPVPAVPHLTADEQDQAMDFAMHDAVFTLYHESGHLLIGELGLTVLGKEEDAADALASILILRNTPDPDELYNTLADVADGWYFSAEETTGNGLADLSYYDEHSFDIERSYAIVCMMVGADQKRFADIANDYGLEDDQQSDCADTYRKASTSWDNELRPFLAKTPGPKIPVSYDNAGHFEKFATELRKRHALEDVSAYLSSHYRLPTGISIHAEVCDSPDAYYEEDTHRIVYCYDLAQDVYDRAAANLFKASSGGGGHVKNAQ